MFESFSQYNILYIDSEEGGYDNFIKIAHEASHEEYEKNYKNIDLTSVVGDTTVILSGAGQISGVILRLLEQLKQNNLLKQWY